MFEFGLAKYMLVTASMAHGWFLANSGSYSIDGGLLAQPRSVYQPVGLGCGEPTAAFVREGKTTVLTVALDIKESTATIHCGVETPSPPAVLAVGDGA